MGVRWCDSRSARQFPGLLPNVAPMRPLNRFFPSARSGFSFEESHHMCRSKHGRQNIANCSFTMKGHLRVGATSPDVPKAIRFSRQAIKTTNRFVELSVHQSEI